MRDELDETVEVYPFLATFSHEVPEAEQRFATHDASHAAAISVSTSQIPAYEIRSAGAR